MLFRCCGSVIFGWFFVLSWGYQSAFQWCLGVRLPRFLQISSRARPRGLKAMCFFPRDLQVIPGDVPGSSSTTHSFLALFWLQRQLKDLPSSSRTEHGREIKDLEKQMKDLQDTQEHQGRTQTSTRPNREMYIPSFGKQCKSGGVVCSGRTG